MIYDIWIKNARILDPSRNKDEAGDVLIHNGRIVSKPDGNFEADEIIDAKGYLITPGLIDFHAHLSYRQSEVGIAPDLMMIPNGVTAAVDAGSNGPANYEGFFHNVVCDSNITMKSFLNVSSMGVITEQFVENLQPELYDVRRMEYLFEFYGKEILGLKVRIGKLFSKELMIEPLKETIKLAEKFNCPVCVHVVDPQVILPEIISLLRKGDILAHCYQGKGYNIIDDNGNVYKEVIEARKRGVIFDVAQGRKNHNYNVAKKAIDQGFFPDVISTDVVMFSIYNKKLFALPYTVSAYHALGIPLMEVFRMVTETPAELMGMSGKIGTLAPGAYADISVFKIFEEDFEIPDLFGNRVSAKKLFIPQMTVKKGKILYRNMEFTFLK